ncbi:type II secretion system GspH family protein [Patescibacteria group bacterium]|nr:type II secretion system GspH family protein [Patescibacteria group bacterium]
MKSNKGFTLIELLVVIAIIGILASVILASLGSARNKGRDAAVKSNLATVRVQAQLYYDIYGKYRNSTGTGIFSTNTCTTGTTMFGDNNGSSVEGQNIASVINRAILAAHEAGGSGGMECKQDATNEKYVVQVKMNSGNYWCIDSAGSAKDIGTSLLGALVYNC